MIRHTQSVAVILGSAFTDSSFVDTMNSISVETPYGCVDLYQVGALERPAWIIFRHGLPHRYLPNQIPYRAYAWALRAAGCGALLITSSVGVLDSDIPLNRLLEVSDILMPDNRLPGGESCTMFDHPSSSHGHLVLRDGLLSTTLRQQVREMADELPGAAGPLFGPVVFSYVGGPRTKTSAENSLWGRLGAQVNSMTVGPEVVLANEFNIPCACICVGHKYSLSEGSEPESSDSVGDSLVASKKALRDLVFLFLKRANPVSPANMLYQFAE